jgi:hypothetical protein
MDAAHALVAQPTLWALLGGLTLNLARVRRDGWGLCT